MPTILIADDSMFQRVQIARTATQAGYDVIEARTGGSACVWLWKNGPKCCFWI
jgi:CheY-like chemotaxis protein